MCTVQPLNSLTQHYLTFGKLDTGLSENWTVGKSTVRPLDTQLKNHRTVGHSINQALRIFLQGSSEAVYFSTHQFELIHHKIIFFSLKIPKEI